jgi:hypothetical protein
MNKKQNKKKTKKKQAILQHKETEQGILYEIQSTEKELLWQLQALLSKLNSHEELYKADFKQGSVTRGNC